MPPPSREPDRTSSRLGEGQEKLSGVVERVTFHSAETGWSVLQVAPFGAPHTRVAVTLHQAKVFAGASVDFFGHYVQHPKYGEQFASSHAVERKPASVAALEKYLGSGLIAGVGPRTARKIVKHFGERTLAVFEREIERLVEVRGIADRKLLQISEAWRAHQALREVMLFLQEHGISTLFSAKIYKAYGDGAVEIVRRDPYRLARDIYGIGFFSADRIALSLGVARDGPTRIDAGIRHVLAASREHGHCFLSAEQVVGQTLDLLDLPSGDSPQTAAGARLRDALCDLVDRGEIARRQLPLCGLSSAVQNALSGGIPPGARDCAAAIDAYYARSLLRDEAEVARRIARRIGQRASVDRARVERWLEAWSRRARIALSEEQREAVIGSVGLSFAVLTGGPGCGKTTTTRAIVQLARAMGKRVTLAAPTGRAAQRMTEVVGYESRTIHRLLEWTPGQAGFSRNAERPLETDLLVVDETSMLDISLTAALLGAVPDEAQILFVGDPDQLPAVGAGDVLGELLRAADVPRFALNEVFRQAETSHIVRFAHAIRRGSVPRVPSPLARPSVWDEEVDCLFLDAEEASQPQIRFLSRAKAVIARTLEDGRERVLESGGEKVGLLREREDGAGVRVLAASEATLDAGTLAAPLAETGAPPAVPEPFSIPTRFLRVDLEKLAPGSPLARELGEVIGRVHPHSVLHHGLSLTDAVLRLYTKTIPERLGSNAEIQILSPMNRGSVGTTALNRAVQAVVTPAGDGRPELALGDRCFRVGDRVIQHRNDYELGVYNGDIGTIRAVDAAELGCEVAFGPGSREHVVHYGREKLAELSLAYAITVHKSQGSEFDAVILPLVTQHYRMLFRGLVYTGLTRAKKLAVFVGQRSALALAVGNVRSRARQTALAHLVEEGVR